MGLIMSDMFVNYENLHLKNTTGKDFTEWITPFSDAISEEGAIPYLIATKERYRASPLASAIIWLNYANLISKEGKALLCQRLLYLRDKAEQADPDPGNQKKEQCDQPGWSLAEGVSVWSTSLAIIAIASTCDEKKTLDDLKESILWLALQQNAVSGGWGYQNIDNCKVNSIMTSLAIQAICISFDKFSFTTEEKSTLKRSLVQGGNYLVKNMFQQGRHKFWTFEGKKSAVATTWALLALKGLSSYDDIGAAYQEFFERNAEKAIKWVLHTIPRNVEKWKDEQLVHEAGAKYNKQKNYYSFSATLIPQLLLLGVSPFHPKIINQIRWIVNDPNMWTGNYDCKKVCSFTYVMLVSTMVTWLYGVGNISAAIFLKKSLRRVDKLYEIILGVRPFENQPIKLITNVRLALFIFGVIFLFFLYSFFNQIITLIWELLSFLWMYLSNNANAVVNGLIVAGLLAIIGFVWRSVAKKRGKLNG